MSILNLLSDWTCYSVAPIALLTEEAFGHINAEQLVVVFLCANGLATACEPIILSRLGLRRTVLFGSLLLMIGSIIKSGGMPPIIQADLKKGEGEWRVYLGFFLVGLSQPLYQCTPALLSASWFPEAERTLATGVALNANQLGIGFAFIFGTLLVETSDDIPKYFSLLSIISTLAFLGTLIQFDDAPPTPPSDTARVMRGTLEVNLPSVQNIFDSVRNIGASSPFDNGKQDESRKMGSRKEKSRSVASMNPVSGGSNEPKSRGAQSDESETRRSGHRRSSRRGPRGSTERNSGRRASGGVGSNTRRRNVKKAGTESRFDAGFHGLAPSPSPARWGPVAQKQPETSYGSTETYPAPSPMMPGNVAPSEEEDVGGLQPEEAVSYFPQFPPMVAGYEYPGQPGVSYNPYPLPSEQYQVPYWDPQYQQFAYFQQQQAQLAYQHGYSMPPPKPYYNYYSYQHAPFLPQPFPLTYAPIQNVLPAAEAIDEGAEPVITIKPHMLEINIRDDQNMAVNASVFGSSWIHSFTGVVHCLRHCY
jgi:Major Facilitator Superfamily